jgi:hypothetical protein
VLAGTASAKDSGASRQPRQSPADPGHADPSHADSGRVDPGLEQPPHLSVSPALFQKFQKLIYSETGIWLGSSKTALLCGRLFRRLRALEITSLASYYEFVAQPDQREERSRMIDAITTNETRFFREPRQFEFLVQRLVPRWQADAEHGLRLAQSANLERRMLFRGRAVHDSDVACPASSARRRLGRAASSH